MLLRIIAAAVLVIAYSFLPLDGWMGFACYLIPYYIVGYDILKKAWKGIKNKQVFDECFLMAIATIGAICLADYKEAVAVMLFYQIGELFQSYAVGKSRQNITELMDIRPDYANIEINGLLSTVDPEEVEIGTTTVIKPGEKIAIDGIVIEGNSSLNTSALTGESVPKEVGVGDEVVSGCVNLHGLLKVKTTKEFGESTVSKILDLVENASNLKSKSEDFIAKFAKVYTPAVCISALVLALLPPVVLLGMGKDAQFGQWLYRGLSFLVISCPCALVISIPLSFFAGIGGASKEGILVKGSNYLETLSQVDTVVFDKTGTITKGVFEVTGIHNALMEEELLLEYAALAEVYSNHPIAESVKKAFGKQLDENRIQEVQEIAGKGVLATIDGKRVAVGNDKLMKDLQIELQPCDDYGTVLHVAIDANYQGHAVISDMVKENARKALEQLRQAGIKKTVMLTGDNDQIAQIIAKDVGVTEVVSELLPDQKVIELEKVLAQAKGKVAFVGDGINDAPVLTRADVGIAMGALGSDAAIEAADVVLMHDDLLKISKAIKISRKCLTIVKENIVFAIAVKLLCLLLGALGKASMWTAIFADVGVMVIAVCNAIRALFVKKL